MFSNINRFYDRKNLCRVRDNSHKGFASIIVYERASALSVMPSR